MDGHRFDGLTRRLSATGSRRAALHAVAASLLAGSLGWRGEPAAAATCTLKANGERCASSGECCSGRCARKRGSRKKFCRQAPGQGICTVVENICDAGTGSVNCNSTGTPTCTCYVTESGTSWCGFNENIPTRCFICDSDADCERREGGQKGDRCVYCSDAYCNNVPPGNTNFTACISRCPNPA